MTLVIGLWERPEKGEGRLEKDEECSQKSEEHHAPLPSQGGPHCVNKSFII